LSGIVQQGGQSVTTDLTVGFQFHLPYLIHEGTPTSLVVATGCDVMVNIILGLPSVTQTKMVINTANQVAEMRALDLPPFAINFRCTMCAVPVINDKIAASNAAKFADIVKEVKGIEAVFAAKTAEHYACELPAFLPPASSCRPSRPNHLSNSITLAATVTQALCLLGQGLTIALMLRQLPTCTASATYQTQCECAL
jgi:hypothetical protein